jgi:hypothetical protein
MTQDYPMMFYARVVNPGTDDEFMVTGDIGDVSDAAIGENNSASPTVARYMLVGTGSLHYTAPTYVEDTVS